jgi:hypothetical protein
MVPIGPGEGNCADNASLRLRPALSVQSVFVSRREPFDREGLELAAICGDYSPSREAVVALALALSFLFRFVLSCILLQCDEHFASQ